MPVATMTDLARRSFLRFGVRAGLCLAAAPMIVRAASLMPVRVVEPDWGRAGDNLTDSDAWFLVDSRLGSDDGPGTASAPLRTIAEGLRRVRLGASDRIVIGFRGF